MKQTYPNKLFGLPHLLLGAALLLALPGVTLPPARTVCIRREVHHLLTGDLLTIHILLVRPITC